MSTLSPRRAFRSFAKQLPFFIWLVAVWMLLWGQFTVLALMTGIIVAVLVTRVFRLPPVELSGRFNLWYAFLFMAQFLGAVVAGSMQVAALVLNPRGAPQNAILAVQLISDDDLIMTHVGVTASLIPGSLITETDRERRILYLHVIGVKDAAALEAQRQSVLTWERRLILAFGSNEQLALVRSQEASA